LARSSSADKVEKPGSNSLILATMSRIWRICRSLELPKRRTSPSETFSESAVKASVVLSQMSLSSSIAPLAPRKCKMLRSKSFKNAILHQIVLSRQAGRTASAFKIGSRTFMNGRSWADSSPGFESFDSAITNAIHHLLRGLATAGARPGQSRFQGIVHDEIFHKPKLPLVLRMSAE
jgi:hypothetical protein